MKSKLRIMYLTVLFLGMTVAFSASCKKAIENATTTCVTTSGCGGKSFKTCANATGGGYYEYNSVKYSWSGTNVTAAATALNTAMGCK
jgi:hypothetical protein